MIKEVEFRNFSTRNVLGWRAEADIGILNVGGFRGRGINQVHSKMWRIFVCLHARFSPHIMKFGVALEGESGWDPKNSNN